MLIRTLMLDRTYVINLKRRVDKRMHMEKEAKKINLDVEFFDAIDGNNVTNLHACGFSVSNWFDPNSGKAMTNGEVGCALSHWLIWKKIVNDVESNILSPDCKILILEDDVVFVENFSNLLERYLTEVPGNYDLLYLHRKPLNFQAEQLITQNIRKVRKSYWTCAYMLTYSGAKKLIDTDYVSNLIPVDEFLPLMYGCQIYGYENKYQNFEKLNAYATYPSLLNLTDNAFYDSETFHSDAFSNTVASANTTKPLFDYIDGQKIHFECQYIGPCFGEGYDRFVKYCQIYGITLICRDYDHKVNETQQLKSAIENSIIASDTINGIRTLVVAIIIPHEKYCYVLPLASPREIIDKFNSLCNSSCTNVTSDKQFNIVANMANGSLVSTLCGWSDELLNVDNIRTCEKVIDKNRNLFDTLNPNSNITFDHKKSRVIDLTYKTQPSFVICNAETSLMLNHIENYTGNNWNVYYGYNIPPHALQELPKIFIVINIGYNTDVMDFIDIVDYPRDLMIIRCVSFRSNVTHTSIKCDINYYDTQRELYKQEFAEFMKSDCSYYFMIEDNCIVNNANILHDLLSANKSIVAPLLRQNDEFWTNFWGDLKPNGFYKRSSDYVDIINGVRRGCWNVPYITGCYLAKREVISTLVDYFDLNLNLDLDMQICANLRMANIFMYVINMSRYGYLQPVNAVAETNKTINTQPTPTTTTSSHLVASVEGVESLSVYDITTRRDDWETKYLHPLYLEHKSKLSDLPTREIADGIYSFPLFSQDFCTEMIALSEKYGKWSKGGNEHNDSRLGANYYENVPTVDVQLFELKLEAQWKIIVFSYIAPMARVLYNNYKTKDINLAFVVKYSHDNQRALEPHHDASTYTINVALNRGNGIDYDGGGCRFIRQNIIVKNQEPGMCCIHPGRLTAYHEGLAVTSGTRYILVSFIN